MKSGTLFSRRFVVVLFVLTALNVLLFGYLRLEKDGSRWDYVRKNDGTLMFAHIQLLEGGYLELSEIHELTYVDHLQGESASEQFRVESLNPQMVSVSPLHAAGVIRIGPSEVESWGEVPADSLIGKELERLH